MNPFRLLPCKSKLLLNDGRVKAVTIKDVLRDNVAVAFPPIRELTRRIAVSHQLAYHQVSDDPRVSKRDKKGGVGNLRRLYIHTDLIQFAEQYPGMVSYSEMMEGDDGYNNRVQLQVGRFVVTAHHYTLSKKMPEDFLNLSANYNHANWSMNNPLQGELFEMEEILKPEFRSDRLNLLILHRASQEMPGALGTIEFVFPKRSQKLITLSTSELIAHQVMLEQLDSDDLEDFKLIADENLRRLIG